MRNILGGITGGIVGSLLASMFMLPIPNFPEPFNYLGFLFYGSEILSNTAEGIVSLSFVIEFLIMWLAIGFIISFFSENGLNVIRTALWLGVVIATFSVAGILLTNPSFWVSPERNGLLLIRYLQVILFSFLTLISAVPMVIMRKKLSKNQVVVAPEKIETTCECGAVFKSKPMICAQCGRTLIYSTSSTDSST
ncbi:MAG: hypothetical protein ACFFF4_07665 [Candidatus Thorarchaeota archaeon]